MSNIHQPSPAKSDVITVSVIIPAFNASALIAECLDSLTKQTCPPDEIIVVDNGSTDDTAAVVNTFSDVRYIPEPTPGVSFARNTGAREASGTILAFIENDCIADDKWIAEAKKIFLSDSNVQGLLGISKGINHNTYATLFQKSYDLFLREITDRNNYVIKIDTKNFFIYKRVFFGLKGFDTSLDVSEGLDLGIRLHRHDIIVKLAPKAIVSHINPVNLKYRIKIRKEEGFFDYLIFKKLGNPQGYFYFPSFGRWYARVFFEGDTNNGLLRLLLLLCEVTIQMVTLLLKAAVKCLNKRTPYIIYHFLMAVVIFKGKLYSRCNDLGLLADKDSIFRREFSRRILK
jgi:glycosyltransferase involved in cell wall biosynthesis